MTTYVKDPDAILDYTVDWDAWLPDTDTITTRTVTADTGITVVSTAIVPGARAVVAWLSGGTVGTTYSVQCRVVTTEGRTDDRTFHVKVAER